MDFLKKYSLAICIVVCAIALSPFSYDRITTIRFFLWSLFALGLYTYIGLYLDFRVIRSPAVWIMGVYTLIVGLSGFLAVNKSEWLYELLKTFLMLAFLVMAITLVNDKIYTVLTVLAVGLSIFGITQINNCRFNGLGGNRNQWSELLVLLIPFCWKHKWVVLLLLVNIFFAQCRGSILTAGVMLIILAEGKWKYLTVGLFAVSISYLCLFDSRALFSPDRLGVWNGTLAMIRDYPFGTGAGNWRLIIPKYGSYFVEPNIFQTLFYNKPHNDYLWIMAETGFAGLVCFVSFLGFLVYKTRHNRILLSGIIGFMMLMFVSFPSDHAIQLILLLTFAGLILKGNYRPVRFKLWPVPLLILMFVSMDFWLRYDGSCQAKEMRISKYSASLDISWFANIDETSTSLYLWRGLKRYELKQLEDTLIDFKEACRKTPNSPLANAVTGAVLIDLDRREEARKYIEKALDLSPAFEPALSGMRILNGI